MALVQFYTVHEVASSLKLPGTTILKWIRDGELGGVKCGRSYRISETQFAEFLQENAIGKPFDASAKTTAVERKVGNSEEDKYYEKHTEGEDK